MGHYDEAYEEDARIALKQEKEDFEEILSWLNNLKLPNTRRVRYFFDNDIKNMRTKVQSRLYELRHY